MDSSEVEIKISILTNKTKPLINGYHSSPGRSYTEGISTLMESLLMASLLLAIFMWCVLIGCLVYGYVYTTEPPEIRLDSVSISSLNLSSSQLSGDWDLRFTMRNPNKHTPIFVKQFEVSVVYDQTSFLWKASAPNDQMEAKEDMAVVVKLVAPWQGLGGSVPFQIAMDFSSGTIDLDFKLRGKFYFEYPGGYADVCVAEISCEDAKIGLLSSSNLLSGTMLGGPIECSYDEFYYYFTIDEE